MTDHVSDVTLAEWREKFGDVVDAAIKLGHSLFAQYESGNDGLDVYIAFQPNPGKTHLWVKFTAPADGMAARIDFTTI